MAAIKFILWDYDKIYLGKCFIISLGFILRSGYEYFHISWCIFQNNPTNGYINLYQYSFSKPESFESFYFKKIMNWIHRNDVSLILKMFYLITSDFGHFYYLYELFVNNFFHVPYPFVGGVFILIFKSFLYIKNINPLALIYDRQSFLFFNSSFYLWF